MLFIVSGVISPILSRRRFLSMVRTCSRRTVESFCRPQLCAESSICGELCFIPLTGDGSRDHSRAVPVADIILDNENRPDTALF